MKKFWNFWISISLILIVAFILLLGYRLIVERRFDGVAALQLSGTVVGLLFYLYCRKHLSEDGK